ncbi:MAG TPA: 2-dehydro-3-deoxygalactonokinase [Allosphingosinicella sp.]|jgi:2-dehydro-3-deoxygalactonokinase|nr:2-dehydro-3-deoxygalactonokinase [Allosphingosinicella sp.]
MAIMDWRDGYIAVDWGTTNRRAYAVDAGGRLADSFEDALGILAVAEGGFEAEVTEIRRRLGDRPILLAGMVGSNRGWRDVPYVACPAGAADVVRSILWIEPGRVGIVPGVSQAGAAGADVMRGEEVQVLGAAAAGLVPPDALVCHPGTHAKWVELAAGRIVSFRTMMTGELFGLLKGYSILADELQEDARADAGFREGVAAALAGEELLAGLFRIRARHLLGESEGGGASYASGLLIGSDVRAGVGLHREGRIALVGAPELCALYAAALAAAGHKTVEVDGTAAFLAGIRLLTEML